MKFTAKLIGCIVLIAASPFVSAADVEKWCSENRRVCDSVVNACESDDSLNCDEYIEKIMSGDFEQTKKSSS